MRLWTRRRGRDEGRGRLTLEHPLEVSAMDVSHDGSLLASGVGSPEKSGEIASACCLGNRDRRRTKLA